VLLNNNNNNKNKNWSRKCYEPIEGIQSGNEINTWWWIYVDEIGMVWECSSWSTYERLLMVSLNSKQERHLEQGRLKVHELGWLKEQVGVSHLFFSIHIKLMLGYRFYELLVMTSFVLEYGHIVHNETRWICDMHDLLQRCWLMIKNC
jgi:hypothetical protein